MFPQWLCHFHCHQQCAWVPFWLALDQRFSQVCSNSTCSNGFYWRFPSDVYWVSVCAYLPSIIFFHEVHITFGFFFYAVGYFLIFQCWVLYAYYILGASPLSDIYLPIFSSSLSFVFVSFTSDFDKLQLKFQWRLINQFILLWIILLCHI